MVTNASPGLDPLFHMIERLKSRRIPLRGANNRFQDFNTWLRIFHELGTFATTTPDIGAHHMRVWYNPYHIDHKELPRISSMEVIVPSIYPNTKMTIDPDDELSNQVPQIPIFGITAGNEIVKKKNPHAFVGDMQIRFYERHASIMTWHNTITANRTKEFHELMDVFTNIKGIKGLSSLDTPHHIVFDGKGTLTEISLKDALIIGNVWKNIIIPRLKVKK